MVELLSTAERPVSKPRGQIVTEASRIEEDVQISAKKHFITSAFWSRFHFWLGLLLVVMSAAAGGSLLTKLGDSGLVGGILSLIVVVLSAVSTFVNGSERATNHHISGANYDSLQNRVRIFRTIDCARVSDNATAEAVEVEVLAARLRDLSDQKDRLNSSGPPAPEWSYREAKKRLENGEGEHAVDKSVRPAEPEPSQ